MTDGTDYAILARDAEWLSGATLLPIDIRRLSMAKYLEQFGADALAECFAQFLGIANSVAANAAEMCSQHRIMDGVQHPDRREDALNMPSPFGALQGALLASRVDQRLCCATCAFRAGTIANQSPVTTADANHCSHPGAATFYCHEEEDEEGEPVRACAGFAQLRKERSR